MAFTKEYWERQQHRLRTKAAALTLPSLDSSRPLFIASQIPCLLLDIDARGAESIDALHRLSSSSSSPTLCHRRHLITLHFIYASLLRAWAHRESAPDDVASNALGHWYAWSGSIQQGIKALEAFVSHMHSHSHSQRHSLRRHLEVELPLLCPTTPQVLNPTFSDAVHRHLVAAMLTTVTDAGLVDVLLRHAAAILLQFLRHPGDVNEDMVCFCVQLMREMDGVLLEKMSICGDEDDDVATIGALCALENALDECIDKSHSLVAEETFSAMCRLRARVSLHLTSSTTATTPARKTKEERHERFAKPVSWFVDLWDSVLGMDSSSHRPKESSGNSGPLLGQNEGKNERKEEEIIVLAVHSVIGALFVAQCEEKAIQHDPNPVSPARILYFMSRLVLPSVQDEQYTDLKIMMWALASMPIGNCPINRDQQRALLRCYMHLHTNTTTTTTTTTTTDVIKQNEHDLNTSWMKREMVSMANRLKTDDEEAIRVLGNTTNTVDYAVSTVFPAALLCPHQLLDMLIEREIVAGGVVGGAVGGLPTGTEFEEERKLLMVEILKEIPEILDAEYIVQQCMEKIRQHMSTSSSSSPSSHVAIEQCLVALCAHFPGQFNVNHIVCCHVLHAFRTSRTQDKVTEHELEYALVRLCRRLIEVHVQVQGADQPVPVPISISTTTYVQILNACLPLLDLSSRRIDLSCDGLATTAHMGVHHHAYHLALLCSRGVRNVVKLDSEREAIVEGELSGDAHPMASLFLLHNHHQQKHRPQSVPSLVDQLCDMLQLYTVDEAVARSALHSFVVDSSPSVGGVELREALVVACAVYLPVCGPEEASCVMWGVQDVVSMLLLGNKNNSTSTTTMSNRVIQVASIEVLCRATHAIAFVPSLVPIAQHKSITTTMQHRPCPLRTRVVGLLVHHINRQCSYLFIDVPTTYDHIVAARAFKEVCRCASVLRPWYDASLLLRVCAPMLLQKIVQGGVDDVLRGVIEAWSGAVDDEVLRGVVASVVGF